MNFKNQTFKVPIARNERPKSEFFSIFKVNYPVAIFELIVESDRQSERQWSHKGDGAILLVERVVSYRLREKMMNKLKGLSWVAVLLPVFYIPPLPIATTRFHQEDPSIFFMSFLSIAFSINFNNQPADGTNDLEIVDRVILRYANDEFRNTPGAKIRLGRG